MWLVAVITGRWRELWHSLIKGKFYSMLKDVKNNGGLARNGRLRQSEWDMWLNWIVREEILHYNTEEGTEFQNENYSS